MLATFLDKRLFFHRFLSFIILSILLFSCAGNESDEGQGVITYININANANVQFVGNEFIFTVTDNLNNDITSESTIYVDGEAISGNTVSFSEVGTYQVKAEYQEFISDILNVSTEISEGTNFKQRILYEDYTGTWCGYCPIAFVRYETLIEQNENVVFVGVHGPAGSSDPYFNSTSSELAQITGVNEYPKMYLNRTEEWAYNFNYSDVGFALSKIQPYSKIGINANSTLNGNQLNAEIDVAFDSNYSNLKLGVYLVEDYLYHTQTNYYNGSGGVPLLYDGEYHIEDYYHKNVLRYSPGGVQGIGIPNNESMQGSVFNYSFSYSIPTGMDAQNFKIIAFIINNEGTSQNARQFDVNTQNSFEIL